jgi:sigma-B regulation protein RsbU (phosphoserine phosphatase)
MGATFRHYVVALQLSLVFTGVILAFFWAFESFGLPRIEALGGRSPSVLAYSALYSAVALAGALVALFAIRSFVLPGFLGDIRAFAAWGMYVLLFMILANAMAIALAYHKGAVEHARRDKELELARRIQHSFLPESFPVDPRIEVHAINVPSRGVSGDFYDVVPAEGALILAVADVEGKSVPAALFTSMLQASLRTQAGSVASTAAILGNVNHLACNRSSSVQQFATFFLARLTEDGKLTYTNAGHNPPLLLRAGGELLHLERGGVMLGVMEGLPYDEEALALAPGDRLLIYTDGLSERANASGEEFGVARLEGLLRALPAGLGAKAVTSRLLTVLEEFAGGVEPSDDQTLLVLCMR